jgi:hypothetical protein
MRRLLPAVLLATLSLTGACGAADEGAAVDEETREADENALTGVGRVQIVVSVDWEGRDLLPQNLDAMKSLRRDYPTVRIVQFLNAAYFTKPGASATTVRDQIKSTLLPTDDLGLHIHGWKRLFEASGVTFRSTPTFWGRNYLSNDCAFDCGHEVPISAYSEPELEKVIGYSIATLEANGLGHARSFRAGGWMAKDNVRQALVAKGILWDSSAVPQPYLAAELGTLPLLQWVGDEWKGTNAASQPYVITTAKGPLKEVPDNGALADYVSADEMVDVFQQAKTRWSADKKKNQVVTIGFHQETAATYLPRIRAALDRILAIAAAEKIPITRATTKSLRVY